MERELFPEAAEYLGSVVFVPIICLGVHKVTKAGRALLKGVQRFEMCRIVPLSVRAMRSGSGGG
jgi:hypothetical protein